MPSNNIVNVNIDVELKNIVFGQKRDGPLLAVRILRHKAISNLKTCRIYLVTKMNLTKGKRLRKQWKMEKLTMLTISRQKASSLGLVVKAEDS
jgi:hypothetical protein